MIKIEYTNKIDKITKLSINEEQLEFIYNCALVKRELSETETKTISFLNNEKSTLLGVLDKKLKTIIPFKEIYENIDILPNYNFIVTLKNDINNIDSIGTKSIHYKYEDEELKEVNKLPGRYYIKLDNDKLLINCNNQKEQYQAIYDTSKGKIISNKFTAIKDFELLENCNEKVALATKEINIGRETAIISCYINLNGEIVTPLYNSLNNEFINTNDNNFNYDEYILKIIEYLNNKKEENLLAIEKLKKLI